MCCTRGLGLLAAYFISHLFGTVYCGGTSHPCLYFNISLSLILSFISFQIVLKELNYVELKTWLRFSPLILSSSHSKTHKLNFGMYLLLLCRLFWEFLFWFIFLISILMWITPWCKLSLLSIPNMKNFRVGNKFVLRGMQTCFPVSNYSVDCPSYQILYWFHLLNYKSRNEKSKLCAN